MTPLETGKAQKAYYDFESTNVVDYNKVKQEILARLDVTLAVFAQQVSSWSFQAKEAPQMFDLVHLVQQWQWVVMGRFLRSLPIPLQKLQGGKSVDNPIELEERYYAAEHLVKPPTSLQTFHPKPQSPLDTGNTSRGSGW